MVFHTGRNPVAWIVVVLMVVLAGLGGWFLWPKARGEGASDPGVDVAVSGDSSVDVRGSTPPDVASASVLADVVAAAEPTLVPVVSKLADGKAGAEMLTDQSSPLDTPASEVPVSALELASMSPEAVNAPEIAGGLDVPAEPIPDVQQDSSTPASPDVLAETGKRGRKESTVRPRRKAREKENSPPEDRTVSSSGFLKRGREAMTLGRLEDAVALLKKAIDAGEDRSTAEALMETCRQRMVQRDYERHLSLGDRAMEEKRWDDCVTQFSQAVKLRGSNPEIERKLQKCREMSVF